MGKQKGDTRRHLPLRCLIFSVHFGQSLFQVLGDLIRAAGIAETAERALHAVDHIFGLHALDQTADALQVAVAAANDLHGRNGVVIVQHKVGLLGTGAAVREAEFLAHSSKSSLFDRNPDEDRLLLL